MKNTANTRALPSAVAKIFNTRMNHPRISEVIEEVQALMGLGSESILMVVGPAGVGKSTLSVTLENKILKSYADEMQANAGIMPVLRVEARATSGSEFNWKLFFGGILESLEGAHQTPAVKYGVNPITNKLVKPMGYSKNTEAALRTKVEKAIQARGVKVLLIDEGAHFTNVSESRMERQTNILKSLANCAGCQIVLFGSYDILNVSRLSAQLARRIREIHFSRYRTDSPDDCSDFRRFLGYIEKSAEGYFQGLLDENAELLQRNTQGCIGTLMNVLKGFVSRAEQQGGVSQKLLEKSLQTSGQCAVILNEIREGEERFEKEGYQTFNVRGAA